MFHLKGTNLANIRNRNTEFENIIMTFKQNRSIIELVIGKITSQIKIKATIPAKFRIRYGIRASHYKHCALYGTLYFSFLSTLYNKQ